MKYLWIVLFLSFNLCALYGKSCGELVDEMRREKTVLVEQGWKKRLPANEMKFKVKQAYSWVTSSDKKDHIKGIVAFILLKGMESSCVLNVWFMSDNSDARKCVMLLYYSIYDSGKNNPCSLIDYSEDYGEIGWAIRTIEFEEVSNYLRSKNNNDEYNWNIIERLFSDPKKRKR